MSKPLPKRLADKLEATKANTGPIIRRFTPEVQLILLGVADWYGKERKAGSHPSVRSIYDVLVADQPVIGERLNLKSFKNWITDHADRKNNVG